MQTYYLCCLFLNQCRNGLFQCTAFNCQRNPRCCHDVDAASLCLKPLTVSLKSVSIQRQDIYKTAELVNEWRERYRKPAVLDEIAYEGNIQHGWGNISGEEMVRRFWEAVCRGGYPGHGETYMSEDDVLWWSHGGILRGESHRRFQLLYQIMEETPGIGLAPYDRCGWDEVCAVPESERWGAVKSYYLYYYSFMRPSFRDFHFDDDTSFAVRVIDTWNMTVEDHGIYKGKFRIELPGRPYMAVQIRKALQE